jgi:hypothetical protein
MNLRPEESELVGQWKFDGRETRGDDACERIESLTANVLEQVAVGIEYGAWETLFRDPADGRLWERTYPEGHMHGGGPPRLKVISEQDARAKYDLSGDSAAAATRSAGTSTARGKDGC